MLFSYLQILNNAKVHLVGCLQPESDVVEELNISPSEAFNQFKGKAVNTANTGKQLNCSSSKVLLLLIICTQCQFDIFTHKAEQNCMFLVPQPLIDRVGQYEFIIFYFLLLIFCLVIGPPPADARPKLPVPRWWHTVHHSSRLTAPSPLK